MQKLTIEPNGWVCTLKECPPGHFVFADSLCFKTEYTSSNGNIEVFNEAGEVFWGGKNLPFERDKIIVQPVIAKWEETI